MRVSVLSFSLLCLLVPPRPGAAQHDEDLPLRTDLGTHHFAIQTGDPKAQAWFDQGLRLLYAGDRAESVRSFRTAERHDPDCVLCAWGVALASGPALNASIDSTAGHAAWAAIGRARARVDIETPLLEQALIEALARRFGPDPVGDRPRKDTAYAQAMRAMAEAFPDHAEVQVLAAEAVMHLGAGTFWGAGGEPLPATAEILARLDRAVGIDPQHPGACHLLAHLYEVHEPARAVSCAERVARRMPGAVHLVELPARLHARIQVTATMAGRQRMALESARKAARTGARMVRRVPDLEPVTPLVHLTLVTFGRWEEVLREPLPPSDLRYPTGMAYYARGVAFAAVARYAEAHAALDTVRAAAAEVEEAGSRLALHIAAHALSGEISLRRGDAARAVTAFLEAVELEDTLPVTALPVWYYPVRHSLGKALVAAERMSEAERVYREDLRRNPDNGWSLFGLAQSLVGQGRGAEAEGVLDRFNRVWARAEVELRASRF